MQTTKMVTELLFSVAGRIPAVPKAANQKQEMSAFGSLMRTKYRDTPPGDSAPQTKSDSKTIAQGSANQSANDAEEMPANEQYALAAALSAPIAGIFMPVQMMADTEPQQQEIAVQEMAILPAGEELQTADVAAQTGHLLDAETAAPEMLLPNAGKGLPAAPETDIHARHDQPVQPKEGRIIMHAAKTEDGDAPDNVELMGSENAQKPVFDAVQSVPVKVGETQEMPIDTESPALDMQLAERLGNALKQGESRIAVRLTPENLGTMQVQLTRSSDGSLRIMLSASTAKAASLLERHSAGLQNLLTASTQAAVKIEVQHSGEGQQAQQYPLDQNGGNHHRGQQERQPQQKQADTQAFMQQLRLGLIELDGTVS